MKRMYAFLILVLPLLALGGCGQTSGNGGAVATGQPTFVANFDPNNSIIPFPDDLLFTGSLDGTLNIPLLPGESTGFDNPKVAMNTLDGFSTIAPISTTFATAANPATIIAGNTLHIYEVTATIQGAVTAIVRELTAAEYKASLSTTDATGRTLVIQPLAPLKSNTRYMVVLTGGIRSTSGLPLVPSSTFGLTKGAAPLVDGAGNSLFPVLTNAQAVALEPLRQLTQTYLAAAASKGVPSSAVALAWTFKTQTINKVLAKIRADSVAAGATSAANFITVPIAPNPAAPPAGTGGLGVLSMGAFAASQGGTLLAAFNAGLFANVGSVVIGAINVPYYLSATGGMGAGGAIGVAPTVLPGAITAHFTVDATGAPTVTSTQTVPFLMTTPNTAGPWPVVIFQHGFTVDKSVMFGIANTLAKAGFATIAIDSVLHGSRTFGLDLVTESVVNGKLVVTANVPDGVADSSGRWYLNLNYLLTFRDNIRQSVADLIHLTRLLEVQTMDVVNNTTGAPGNPLAPDGADLLIDATHPISYVGHSNGGILGAMLAAVEPAIKTFVLANPGGVYSDIALHSAEISPLVLGGLAAKGITPTGAPDQFNSFFVAAQTTLDDGDPINYAGIAAAPANAKKLLMFKQLGDLVVPNTATDALAAAFGMKQVANTPAAATWPLGAVASPFPGSGFTFFTKGTHSSFLTADPPAPSVVGSDVITEMQSETANYLGSALASPSGATVVIGATPLPSGSGVATIMQ